MTYIQHGHLCHALPEIRSLPLAVRRADPATADPTTNTPTNQTATSHAQVNEHQDATPPPAPGSGALTPPTPPTTRMNDLKFQSEDLEELRRTVMNILDSTDIKSFDSKTFI